MSLGSLSEVVFNSNHLSSTALIYGNQSLSYLELQKLVDLSIEDIGNQNSTPGDVVVCWSDNHPRILAQLFACEKLDLKFMPISLKTPDSEIKRLCQVFPRGQIKKGDSWVGKIENNTVEPFKSKSGVVLRSSGSTGPSQVLLHSYSSLLNNALISSEHQKMTDTTKVLVSLYLSHTGGLNMQTLPALTRGGTVILDEDLSKYFLSSAQIHEPTHSIFVPSQVRWYFKDERFRKSLASSLQFVVTGSTPVSKEDWLILKQNFENVLGVYGLSEVGPFVALADEYIEPIANSHSFLGKPLPEYTYKIIDGEIALSGSSRAETLKNREDPFWKTGDLGIEDSRGLFFCGRKKRTINVAGFKFPPEEVESLLISNNIVEDCVVLGKPHPVFGQVPIIIVKGDQKEEIRVRRFCSNHLTSFKRPRHYYFLKDFPRTEIEKADFSKLEMWLNDETL